MVDKGYTSIKRFLHAVIVICIAFSVSLILFSCSTNDHIHSFGEWTIEKSATCIEPGLQSRVCACGEKQTIEISAIGHSEEIDDAISPTCTATGKTEGKHCSVCGEIIVPQETIPANGHAETIDSGISPTCTEPGISDGIYCSICGEVIASKETVPAKGHTEIIDPEILPTCTENGISEGKHCSVCGEVIVAQETVTAKGHTAATDPAVSPTCIEAGKTEGSHCADCNIVLVEQKNIPPLGHKEGKTIIENEVETSCTKDGKYDEVTYCQSCNKELSRKTATVPHGHIEVTDKAISPTCTKTGLTEGKHCSRCNQVLVKQEVIDALGHTPGKITENIINAPTCTDSGSGYLVTTCSTCGTELSREYMELSPRGHDFSYIVCNRCHIALSSIYKLNVVADETRVSDSSGVGYVQITGYSYEYVSYNNTLRVTLKLRERVSSVSSLSTSHEAFISYYLVCYKVVRNENGYGSTQTEYTKSYEILKGRVNSTSTETVYITIEEPGEYTIEIRSR